MKQYLQLLSNILDHGTQKGDRTGVGTRSLFGYQMRFDLSHGFPLLTTKKMFWKGIVHELIWFLRGDTNIKYLHDNDIHIWDEWADDRGDLGPIYPAQWRNWDHHVDQIKNLVHEIRNDPYSRRMIVTAWNPSDVPDMRLPCCHVMFQCNVADGKLSLHMYQRSADVFLGVPFNIASYALLTHILAHITGFKPGHFIHSFGDVHIYNNHVNQVMEQLKREPLPLPRLKITRPLGALNIDWIMFEDFELEDYRYYPPITAQVAV